VVPAIRWGRAVQRLVAGPVPPDRLDRYRRGVTDDDYLDLMDEIRDAAVGYEDAYAACPREGRLTSRPVREAAYKLHDATGRYLAERDRRRGGS
jgi:hypothetical protein